MAAAPCTDKKDGRGDTERPEADAQMGPNVDEEFLFRIVQLEPISADAPNAQRPGWTLEGSHGSAGGAGHLLTDR